MRGDDPAHTTQLNIQLDVFPACAGMIPARLPNHGHIIGVPRMRGDDPDIIKVEGKAT